MCSRPACKPLLDMSAAILQAKWCASVRVRQREKEAEREREREQHLLKPTMWRAGGGVCIANPGCCVDGKPGHHASRDRRRCAVLLLCHLVIGMEPCTAEEAWKRDRCCVICMRIDPNAAIDTTSVQPLACLHGSIAQSPHAMANPDSCLADGRAGWGAPPQHSSGCAGDFVSQRQLLASFQLWCTARLIAVLYPDHACDCSPHLLLHLARVCAKLPAFDPTNRHSPAAWPHMSEKDEIIPAMAACRCSATSRIMLDYPRLALHVGLLLHASHGTTTI